MTSAVGRVPLLFLLICPPPTSHAGDAPIPTPATIPVPSPATASPVALAPWMFGMTPQQVASFGEYGPYRSFKNGDVETYAYPVGGAPRNVQFYFGSQVRKGAQYGEGLRRISIHFYEGTDLKEAEAAWRETYIYLQKTYGPIEVPDIHIESATTRERKDAGTGLETLSRAAAANTEVTGKTQMAPILEPEGLHIFSSFIRREYEGTKNYEVVFYIDPPR